MFNEISVFNLRRRKKKDKSYIIPSSAIVETASNNQLKTLETVVELPVEHTVVDKEIDSIDTLNSVGQSLLNQSIENDSGEIIDVIKVTTTSSQRPVSALSLSSIRKRRELESSIEKKVINPDDLPKEAFNYEQLMVEWNKYSDRLTRSGFMLMASLMGMVQPILKGSSISLEMPNEGSKLSFEENKYDLANYLRKKLSNYDIEIDIIVNEEIKIAKKVFDNKDKLQRFIELNPAMELFKEVFQLELK